MNNLLETGSSMSHDAVVVKSVDRRLGLDALRGMAIVWMAMAAVIPGGLPNWLYHGYYPRWLLGDATNVTGVWIAASGFQARWGSFTIIDWVFPGFLFAMGAAIPAALMPRLDRGESRWKLAGSVVIRTVGLLFFAVYVRVVSPGEWVGKGMTPGMSEWLLALLAFVVPFVLYVRLSKSWQGGRLIATRVVGLLLCVGMIALNCFWADKPFGVQRFDIIIALLAHTYLLGGLLWLLCGRSSIGGAILLVLMLLIGLVAHHESINTQKFGDWRFLGTGFSAIMPVLESPTIALKWLRLDPLWGFGWYQYAIVVGLGIWTGERLLNWNTRPQSTGFACGLMGAGLLVVMSVFVGLRNYDVATFGVGGWMTTPWPVVLVGGPALLAFAVLAWRIDDRSLRTMIVGTVLILLAGVTLSVLKVDGQYFQGGIKKGPPAPLSYYLVSSGISAVMLIAMTVWIDAAKLRGLLVVALVGQNALLAYIGIRNVIGPVLNMPVLASIYEGKTLNQFARLNVFTTPWTQLVWAVIVIAIFSVGVAWLSKRKILWRV